MLADQEPRHNAALAGRIRIALILGLLAGGIQLALAGPATPANPCAARSGA